MSYTLVDLARHKPYRYRHGWIKLTPAERRLQARRALAKAKGWDDLGGGTKGRLFVGDEAYFSNVDLSRHVRDAAYWHKPVGTVISGATSWTSKVPTGKHLTLTSETDRYAVAEKDPVKIAADIQGLVEQAQGAAEGSTEWENNWGKVATHLEALNEHVKDTAKPSRPKRPTLIKKPTVEAKVKVADSVTKDTAIRLRDDQLLHGLINAGIHVTGAASGILGAETAVHMSEAFSHMAENPVFEAGLISVVVLAIHALIVRIKRALNERRDKRIKMARTNSVKAKSAMAAALLSDPAGHEGRTADLPAALNTASPFHIR